MRQKQKSQALQQALSLRKIFQCYLQNKISYLTSVKSSCLCGWPTAITTRNWLLKASLKQSLFMFDPHDGLSPVPQISICLMWTVKIYLSIQFSTNQGQRTSFILSASTHFSVYSTLRIFHFHLTLKFPTSNISLLET